MKTNTKFATLALAIAAIAFAGCSSKEEEPQMSEADVKAAAEEAAAASQAESDKKMDEKLATGLADIKKQSEEQLAATTARMEEELADQKAKLQEEMDQKLAQQSAALKEQFAASNQALRNQLESLTDKYNAIKGQLPDNVTSAFSEKLPDLKSSLGSLESIVSNFNPSSLEQLQDLKTKYQSELDTAKQIADQLLKMLGNTSLGDLMPKL